MRYGAGLGTLGLALMPAAALACALPPSIILTLPTGQYIAAAGAVVALTALLAALAPRLPGPGTRALIALPDLRAAGTLLSCLSCGITLALIWAGRMGSPDPMHNLLTLAFWVGVWIAVPLAAMLCGNLWAGISPFPGPVRLIRRALGWQGQIGLARFGAVPAILGFAGFSWFQLIFVAPEDPYILSRLVAGYGLVILILAVLEGEDWLQEGEFLTLLFALLSRVAPVWVARRSTGPVLMTGLPGAQIAGLPALTRSQWIFVTAVLAALSFDGLMETFWWQGLIGQNPLEPLGRSAVAGVNTLGLLGIWGLTVALLALVLALGARAGIAPGPVMRGFLAIAAGYHIAHYLVTLLTAGQYAALALNDPLMQGDSWLGLPEFYVSFGFLTDPVVMPLIYGAQFGAILLAHLMAVILSLQAESPSQGPAGAGKFMAHLPLTVLMVAYTVFGLWLLSTARSG